MASKVFKSIVWAFPTSHNAEHLGFGKEGCWHISLTAVNTEGRMTSNTYMPHDAEGFAEPDDADLIALFHEYKGDICPLFKQYGNNKALAAIGKFMHMRRRIEERMSKKERK